MEEIIDFLDQSAVFAMSLGSKELFHSNFWAWLMKIDPAYADAFFDGISEKIERVEREEKNRDITIWTKDNKAYVIENKLKSIPYKEQLENYQNELGPLFAGGLLTGVISCERPDRWEFKSYGTIGEKIREIAERENNNFRKALIQEYADVICKIAALLSNLTTIKYPDQYIVNQLDERIIKLRFDDVVKKLQAEKFKMFLKRQVDGAEICIINDFSNGDAIVNVYYESTDFNVGISIQGKQFRRVISGNGSAKAIFEKGRNAGYFAERTERVIFGKRTGMRKDFCKFEGSIGVRDNTKNTHVYQYWNVENFSFEALKNEIIQQMQVAAEAIRKM